MSAVKTSKHDLGGTDAVVGISGALAFLQAFMLSPTGTETVIRVGCLSTDTEQKFVIAAVAGVTAAFTPKEARSLAKIAADTIGKFGVNAETNGLADLVLCLRDAAGKAERS